VKGLVIYQFLKNDIGQPERLEINTTAVKKGKQ
jgi:hypothetical protein